MPIVLLAAAFALAADPADNLKDSDAVKLKDSLAKWEKAKEQCGGDYSYTTGFTSAFGFGSVTTVTVTGNKVAGRKYETFTQDGGKRVTKQEWAEEGKDVGTHTDGAPAKTLDDLYADAKKVCDGKVADGHVRSVGFDKAGLLAYCYTRDTRIADDAPLEGVRPFTLTLKAKK